MKDGTLLSRALLLAGGRHRNCEERLLYPRRRPRALCGDFPHCGTSSGITAKCGRLDRRGSPLRSRSRQKRSDGPRGAARFRPLPSLTAPRGDGAAARLSAGRLSRERPTRRGRRRGSPGKSLGGGAEAAGREDRPGRFNEEKPRAARTRDRAARAAVGAAGRAVSARLPLTARRPQLRRRRVAAAAPGGRLTPQLRSPGCCWAPADRAACGDGSCGLCRRKRLSCHTQAGLLFRCCCARRPLCEMAALRVNLAAVSVSPGCVFCGWFCWENEVLEIHLCSVGVLLLPRCFSCSHIPLCAGLWWFL